jgi:hypothetical protein
MVQCLDALTIENWWMWVVELFLLETELRTPWVEYIIGGHEM